MFSTAGFLGTRAPMYLDIVGIAVLLLPFLLFFSVREARMGRIKNHLYSQMAIFLITLLVVILFEVGVRLSGGFSTYLEQSNIGDGFFIGFLVVHVLTALATVNVWSYQLISSYKAYRRETLIGEAVTRHKKIAKWLVLGIFVTILQGIAIYFMLFVS